MAVCPPGSATALGRNLQPADKSENENDYENEYDPDPGPVVLFLVIVLVLDLVSWRTIATEGGRAPGAPHFGVKR